MLPFFFFFDRRKTSHHSRAVTFTQIGDYMEAGTGTTSFFFILKRKKFSIILSISRMTWKENLAPEGSMQSRLPPHPLCDPYLHLYPAYCFSIQEGCSPPPQPHSPQAPVSSGALPYLPPTIASPVTIIFLFHQPTPWGQGVWRWRQDLSLNWQNCCAFCLSVRAEWPVNYYFGLYLKSNK